MAQSWILETALRLNSAVGARQDTSATPEGGAGTPFEIPDGPEPRSARQDTAIALLFVFAALGLILVALRLFIRIKLKQFGTDDALICAAMAFSLAATGACYMSIKKSYTGIHLRNIPPAKLLDFRDGLLWNWILQILYNPILALVKSSVLVFLLRLGGHRQSLRYLIHAVNAVNLCLMVGIICAVVFQCTPVDFFWNKTSHPNGKCIQQGVFYTSTAAITIFTDVVVLAIPFWIFTGLKMNVRVKIAVMGIFLLGGIVTIISCLRLVWLVSFVFKPIRDQGDFTYNIGLVYGNIETNLAIMSACAPALRGLVGQWFPHYFSTFNSSTRDGASHGHISGQAGRSGERSAVSHSHAQLRSFEAGKDKGFTETYRLREMKNRAGVATMSPSPSTSEEEIMRYHVSVQAGRSER